MSKPHIKSYGPFCFEAIALFDSKKCWRVGYGETAYEAWHLCVWGVEP